MEDMVSSVNTFNSVFKDKCILVTGHTGFKGSWMSIWLELLGAKVIGYALDPYTSSDNFVVTKIGKRIVDIRGDVRNQKKLSSTFKKYKPDIVLHFAAQALVQESYKSPKYTFDVNIGGTVNVLENCRMTDSVKHVIVITSDKCYENRGWDRAYVETDPMGGFDPYSSSKGCCEIINSAYMRSYFNTTNKNLPYKAIASVRAGNVIGGGDWSENRIFPDCIRAIEDHQKIVLRNPMAVRPWQHVLEALGGYLVLLSKMIYHPEKYNGAWNFGPELVSHVTVRDVVDIIIKAYGFSDMETIVEENRFHEAKLLKLDISKAKEKLGWRPVLDLETAIQWTIKWYLKYKNADMLQFCRNQIEEYMGILKHAG